MLDQIEVPADRPAILTISGNGGLGKTSLAATFPKPIFIRAEDGLSVIPVERRPKAFPVLHSVNNEWTPCVDQLWAQLTALIKEPHDYKTLVIDSITQLDTIFQNVIVESDANKPASINQALGGYGAGWSALSGMHGRVRRAAGILNTVKAMNIVFIAHADTESLDLPDQDAYSVYTIRMHKKSVQHYLDNVDLIGFVRLETYTMGKDGERKRALSDGTRVVTCHAVASSVSKNRFGITNDLPFEPGKNPFAGLIPGIYNGDEK